MTEGRPQGGQSAANTGAVRRAVPWMGAALVAAVALLTGLAAPATAASLIITGGPVYTLPGGGTCTLSGAAASAAANTKELLKAKGSQVPAILGPMGLDAPVTAQLINHGSGVCWEGSFATPLKNSATQFKGTQ